MRLHVVDVRPNGDSFVRSSVDVAHDVPTDLWDSGPFALQQVIDRYLPSEAFRLASEPKSGPGGCRWVYQPVLSEDASPEAVVAQSGRHVTRTVDFDVVVSGQVRLLLDEDELDLDAGDLVVLSAARHGWVKRGGGHAAILCLLYQPVLDRMDDRAGAGPAQEESRRRTEHAM